MKASYPLLATASLLFLAGCNTPGKNYKVYIDPSFTVDQQQVILNSLQTWEQTVSQFSGETLTFTPMVAQVEQCGTVDCNAVITIIPVSYAELVAAEGTPVIGHTSYNKEGDWANVRITTDEYDSSLDIFGKTVMHELGHAMDLAHTGKNTIMYAAEGHDTLSAPTCFDVDQWMQVRGLPEPKCE